MKMYIIAGVVILITIISVYFLFFYKNGAKSYFTKALRAIDSMNKNSENPPIASRSKLLSAYINPKLVSSDEVNFKFDFGEKLNGIYNDLYNVLSKKLCNKDSTKKFPMSFNDFENIDNSVIVAVYNSEKITKEEKEDYLATLGLLDTNSFTIENDLVKFTISDDKTLIKLIKIVMPTLDDSKDVFLTLDQFKTINYKIISMIFDPEKYVTSHNIIHDNNIPIINMDAYKFSGGLFNILILDQLLTNNKLSEEEKARMNIYIFGNTTTDSSLFVDDSNGTSMQKLFKKLNGDNDDDDKKLNVIKYIIIFMALNDININVNGLVSILPSGSLEEANKLKNDINDLNLIVNIKEDLKIRSLCEVI